MELIAEPLLGVKILRPFVFEDERGKFVKTFHEGALWEHGITMCIREEFYSTSAKNVIRGMHFQLPPHAHKKLVYCSRGKVLDVLVDLRRESPDFGRSISFELSERNNHIVYIPVGLAHGFMSLEEDSCLVYKTDAVYAPESDSGIRWDECGFQWPLTGITPLISSRDESHPSITDFSSPF